EDLGGYDKGRLIKKLDRSIDVLDRLLLNAEHALKLHQGVRIAICGRPNAGKSTLMNLFCGEDRAIVHDTAGTTRDVIEARVGIDGVAVTLVDVAGIREADESGHIEMIGIERAFVEFAKAQAVIWLADGTGDHWFDDQLIA